MLTSRRNTENSVVPFWIVGVNLVFALVPGGASDRANTRFAPTVNVDKMREPSVKHIQDKIHGPTHNQGESCDQGEHP